MSDIKQKAIEMFGERFNVAIYHQNEGEDFGDIKPTVWQLQMFIEEAIDLAIAEERKRVVDIVVNEISDATIKGEQTSRLTRIYNIITNTNK